MKILDNKNWSKITVIGFLLVICLLSIYYFHFVLKTEVVFVHLFYIPITLACLWWSRRGIAVAIFLALMLLVSHILSPLESFIWADMTRASMFLIVGTVIAVLNAKMLALMEKLRLHGETLEQQVEVRTKEIRELQEKQYAILDGIGDAIIVLNNELNIIWANRIAIERYGTITGKKCYEALKWLKEPCSDCVARKTFTECMIDRNTFAQCAVTSAEKEGILKSGERINFIATCSPARDRNGTVISVVEVLHDITERKRAEDEILAMNRNLSTMYSIATIATRSFELDEILNGILKETLDFLEIAAGEIYLIDEDAGEAVLHVQHGFPDEFVKKVRSIPLDSPTVASILELQEPIITQELPSGEETVKSAEYGIEKVVIFQLCSREKVVGFVALSVPAEREIGIKDMLLLVSIGNQAGIVVENVRLFEETKKSYEELKSLDRMKDEFLSNVSHELKTPLVSIEGYSEVLSAGTLGELNEQQKKAVDTVMRNADRLERLINSILYLSIEEAGRMQYIFKPLQIANVIEKSISDMLLQIKRNNLNIKKEVQDNLPLIQADEDRILQVMVNLISNSVKFTTSGEIVVKAYVDKDDDNLHIEVNDTGIGISKEHINNLFDRFYQGDASMKRKYGGTGLGLHISKHIVEAHKGKIWAESEEGVGTTIHFTLPM
ncbi:MAG TPA: PAS domain-containing protein [Methanosarcinaceae archaeon]|nr:PAS domain-containing protein [Methanosarcinaceae archaeon]